MERPKLYKDDVVAKPIHTILDQLSKIVAAGGFSWSCPSVMTFVGDFSIKGM